VHVALPGLFEIILIRHYSQEFPLTVNASSGAAYRNRMSWVLTIMVYCCVVVRLFVRYSFADFSYPGFPMFVFPLVRLHCPHRTSCLHFIGRAATALMWIQHDWDCSIVFLRAAASTSSRAREVRVVDPQSLSRVKPGAINRHHVVGVAVWCWARTRSVS
jgi:hypothetical protein